MRRSQLGLESKPSYQERLQKLLKSGLYLLHIGNIKEPIRVSVQLRENDEVTEPHHVQHVAHLLNRPANALLVVFWPLVQHQGVFTQGCEEQGTRNCFCALERWMWLPGTRLPGILIPTRIIQLGFDTVILTDTSLTQRRLKDLQLPNLTRAYDPHDRAVNSSAKARFSCLHRVADAARLA